MSAIVQCHSSLVTLFSFVSDHPEQFQIVDCRIVSYVLTSLRRMTKGLVGREAVESWSKSMMPRRVPAV